MHRGMDTMEIPMSKISSKARGALPKREFAFPLQRKEPLENASHVRNAIARFDQVIGVTDAERDDAWQRILLAARTFGVTEARADWRDPAHHAAAQPA